MDDGAGLDLSQINLNQQALFQCMKKALEKTKIITKIIREKWAKKDQEFSLLDSSQQVVKRSKNTKEGAE